MAQAKSDYDYDLVIIGCGVGGHGAALHAVESVSRVGDFLFGLKPSQSVCRQSRCHCEQGLKTAVIEGHDIGGTCVNRGCVPSKALLAASGRVRELQNTMHMKALGIQVRLSCYISHA